MVGWGEDGLECVEHWAGEGWWHQAQTLLPGPLFTEEVQPLQISRFLLDWQGSPGMRNTWVLWEPEAPHPRHVPREFDLYHLSHKHQCSWLSPTPRPIESQHRGHARCGRMGFRPKAVQGGSAQSQNRERPCIGGTHIHRFPGARKTQ